MSLSRIVFLLFSAGLTLLGLLTVAAAQDRPLLIFGWGVVGFGLLFGFSLVKRHYDETEA